MEGSAADARQSRGLYHIRESQRNLPASDELREAAPEAQMQDIWRLGLTDRLKRRLHSNHRHGKAGTQDEAGNTETSRPSVLVRDVMETSGGDNEALARKVKERYQQAGVARPSVEIRFDNLTAKNVVPASQTKGHNTVGRDLKSKVMKLVNTAARRKPPMREVRILHGVTGIFKPGRITLVLGPPGGGKTMLMKACVGAAPVQLSGDVTFNGHAQSEFNVRRTARYVDQFDLHNAQLTVRETLMFSALVQGPGYNRSIIRQLEAAEKEKGITPDPAVAELLTRLHNMDDPSANVALVLQLLSLVNCADTIVGGGLIRGVSGGERKRVTTGEVIVGPTRVLFMDEISTGLDSASTFTITQSLRNAARALDATIVVALLQPEPQVYDLFDDVLLLANGRILYHGPRTSVQQHFQRLGFELTGTKAEADFLQELASAKDQPALRTDRGKFEPQLDFVPPAALAAAFQRSDTFQETRRELDEPFDRSKSHPGALMHAKYGVPGWDAVKAIWWRERVLQRRTLRQKKYRWGSMAAKIVLLSTLFVQKAVTGDNSVRAAQNLMGFLFYSGAYMQFLGISECAKILSRLPVFYKQKYKLFYPGWAFAIPWAINDLPMYFGEVTVWSVILYFATGCEYNAGRFFTYWGTLVALQMQSSTLFRLIGSTIRSTVTGTSVAVLCVLLNILGSGFVLLRSQMGWWWRWITWVAPLGYAFTGLTNNEFLGESYRDPGDLAGTPLARAGAPEPNAARGIGVYLLEAFQIPIGTKWRWIAPVYLLGVYVLLNLGNIAALHFLGPPPRPPPPPPPQEDDYLLDDGAVGNESKEAPAHGAQPGVASTAGKRGRSQASTAAGSGRSNGPVTVELGESVRQASSGTESAPHKQPPRHSDIEAQDAQVAAASASSGSSSSCSSAAGGANGASGRDGDSALNLPFEPVTLTFNDLHYFVPNPKGEGELELLKGIYGVFRPAVLTALMGASGAGKTTLMDVLADRKTAGRMTGAVKVNGFDKDPPAFARIMGYCEQDDVHSSGATVRESVRLSGRLRLGDAVTSEQFEEFVEQTMHIVELDVIGDQVVGIPGQFGLSGEQFKRLTIAVELVANPSIIFCDEPTSGLDARAAQIVMRVVRNIVNNGRTIVCTIHQPSTEIFLHFDELLLLKRGGWPIYYGPLGDGSRDLVRYFESVDGTKKLQQGYNPATYMLEATTTAEEERLGVDFGDLWGERQKEAVVAAVQEAEQPAEGAKQISFGGNFATNRLVQYKTLLARYGRSYWRNPPFNTTRLLLALIAALAQGTFYWGRGSNYEDAQSVQAILGSLFSSIIFLGFINFQMIIPTFLLERPVMTRERASRLYSVLPWVQAMEDVEIPWIILQSIVFAIPAYFMIQFEFAAEKFFLYLVALVLSVLTMTYLGMVMVCVTPNVEMGVTIGSMAIGFWFILSGFLIPRPAMPGWWVWAYFLVPVSWEIYAIVADQLGDKEQTIEWLDGSEMVESSISQYIEANFGYKYHLRWPALAIALAFILLLRSVVMVATKYINFSKR